MEELRDLVALSVPAGSRVLAVAPDPPLLESLAARNCRTWSVVPDDSPAMAVRALCEGVMVGELDQLDLVDAFPGLDFDTVVLMGALAHVMLPGSLLRKITKVLVADGRVVASVPNATHHSRRLRFWQGVGQDEEVGPGRRLLRAFNGEGIDALMNENGLGVVEKLRVRRAPADPPPHPSLPPAVLAFLESDDEADVDHYVVIASPAAGPSVAPALAEELQRRLHRAEEEVFARQTDLATLEHELATLHLDLVIKDDFALELQGRLRTAEAKVAATELDRDQIRAALDSAKHQLREQAREMDGLRRATQSGVLSLLYDRIRPGSGRRRHTSGTADPTT